MRQLVVLVTLLLLPMMPAVADVASGPPEEWHGVHELRELRTLDGVTRGLDGAAPRFFSIMPSSPIVHGHRTMLSYTGGNHGAEDFDGVIRVRSDALGLDDTRAWDLGSGWFIFGWLHFDTRDFDGPAFDLAITLEDERGVVESWERTFTVADENPCDGRAALFGSGGMKHVVPGEVARYGIMLCNDTAVDRTATIVMRDSLTQRPIVGALEAVRGPAFGGNSQYEFTVSAGAVSGMHYVLEEMPGVVELRPEAIVLWHGDGIERVQDLDPVTYAPGEDAVTLLGRAS